MSSRRRRVLLDERGPRALLGDDDETPEGLARHRDAHVERLLEHDALRDHDEQPVLPHGGVVRRELLRPPDERVQPVEVLGQRLEAHAFRRLRDVDAVCRDRCVPGDVEVEHRRDLAGRGAAERVGIEAGEIGEAPVLLGRVRDRQCVVRLECGRPAHDASNLRCSISALPSESRKNAMWQTGVSWISPWNSTPASSSVGARLGDVRNAQRDVRDVRRELAADLRRIDEVQADVAEIELRKARRRARSRASPSVSL